MNITIEVVDNDLFRRLNKLSKTLESVNKRNASSSFRKALKEDYKHAGKPLLFTARRLAPVRSGALRSSIKFMEFDKSKATFIGPDYGRKKIEKKGKSARQLNQIRYNEHSTAYYAAIVHNGVPGRFQGRKYLQKAFKAKIHLVNSILKRRISKRIDDVTKQYGL